MDDAAQQLGLEPDGERARRRRNRTKRKRRSRKREKLMRNLAWLGGGLAVGLPVLALILFAMSRY